MNHRLTLFTLLLLTLLVSACSGSTSTSPVAVTESHPPDEQAPYPSSLDVVNSSSLPWYPAPGTPGAPGPGTVMTTGYEPQPGDASLTRGPIYLELDSSQLIIMESLPIQVMATLSGNLPDPCHRLRVAVTAADTDNRINLEVYSLVSSTEICTTVLEPFAATIPLGTYSGGHFSVYVNGELLGEFDS
jgi:hypothetical protein